MANTHWTLLGIAPSTRDRRYYYYRCSCGTLSQLPMATVTSGRSRSCGCQKTKGTEACDVFDSKHPLRNTHGQMKSRCLNPKHHAYKRYKGKLCKEWLDFEVFASYIEQELGPRPPGHSLDRIDSQLGYCPGNVRWATNLTQSRNR